MSRPKPTIILSYVDPKTHKAEQVLQANAIYAVFHDGKPVNIRTLHTRLDYPPPKYNRKSSYPNAGHAFNQAARLNKLFKTDKFAVYELTTGCLVEEHED